MQVIVDLKDCYPILDEQSQERWDDLKDHNKLEAFFEYCNETFEQPIKLVELSDFLKYEYEDLAQKLNFEPYSDVNDYKDNFEENLQKLNNSLREALEEPEIITYNFTFEVINPDLVKITDETGNSYEVDVDTSNREYLFDTLESNLGLQVAPELVDDDYITGTEIVGFQYDEDSKTGSFEFNIFYSDELQESLNEGKKFYLGWRSNPQLKNGGYYKKYGQLTKKEASQKERTAYGSMSLQAYDTEEEYNKAIEDAKNDGFSVSSF